VCATMAIDGTWYNELGSTMRLVIEDPGALSGTYQSGVGTSGEFDLIGSYDTAENTLGFVVTWNNGSVDRASTTTWCAQNFEDASYETLVTTWLLCETTAETDTWQSNLVGQDQFTRSQPSAAEIDAKRKLRTPAHPRALDAS
jgi:hypothetical protein